MSCFQFDTDPDPAPHERDENLRPLSYSLFTALFLSLHASIVSVQGPPWLHFELLKRLYFDYSADSDPASHNPDPQTLLLASLLFSHTGSEPLDGNRTFLNAILAVGLALPRGGGDGPGRHQRHHRQQRLCQRHCFVRWALS